MKPPPADLPGGAAEAELSRILLPQLKQRDASINLDEAPPGELAALGLPLRPDFRLAPAKHAIWQCAVAARHRIVTPRPRLLRAALEAAPGGDPAGPATGAAGAAAGRWGSSRNWSGAVLAATDGELFNSVTAGWTVPRARLPSTPPSALPGGRYQTSVWIGLDGFRLASLSLPQVGTVSEFDPALAGQPDPEDPAGQRPYAGRYYLFVQWWVRGKRFGEVEIEGFEVHHGDAIRAHLDVLNPTNVQFHVENLTRGIEVTLVWQSGQYEVKDVAFGTTTDGILGEGKPVVLAREEAPVEGRHAVFCVERPSVMPAAHLSDEEALQAVEAFALPDFDEVIFTGAMAEARAPGAAAATERDLTGARLLRLMDRVLAPEPKLRILTTPQPPPEEGFPRNHPRDSLTILRA